jgi:hypothetical protein
MLNPKEKKYGLSTSMMVRKVMMSIKCSIKVGGDEDRW